MVRITKYSPQNLLKFKAFYAIIYSTIYSRSIAMFDITKIDANFKVGNTINIEGIKYYSCFEPQFSIHGIKHNGIFFYRLPDSVAAQVNEGVKNLGPHTAGGRIRFKTSSPYVAISVKYACVCKMAHFAFCGSIGFDLYADGTYISTYSPAVDIVDTYEGVIYLGESKMREITINFPLYSAVNMLFIGLDEKSEIEPPAPYKNPVPAVFYGSSITQGGCASRPGTCYQAPVSRHFDLDYINLGFAGSALGEDVMADYISGLEMSAFFYDYDHNAPSTEHLLATHEKMFKKIREKNPNLPIICMSRPIKNRNADENRRLEIVKATYENARAQGDENVYFLGGDDLTALCGNEGTVDNCHPTDFGFGAMADAIIKLCEKNKIF